LKIYNVSGGIGRQISFTALIPKLAEKEKIYILSPYPDIFQNNPYVSRVLPMGMPYIWIDYVSKKDNEVISPEPYFNNRFIHKECHIIDAFCEECKIDYDKSMIPAVYLPRQLEVDAENFKKENSKFIIVQLTGGQTPFGNLQGCYVQQGQKRFYPIEQAKKLIELLRKEFPDYKILNMSLPNEYKLDGTIQVAAPYLFYVSLLKHCGTFIGIDSSLNHMSACARKKGVVLWMGTSPVHFGYDQNVNLCGECKFNDLHCSRPYVRDLGDLQANGQPWDCPEPSCQSINPERIIKECHSILNV
jgi:ADP-heptose:LPS heptosyltransferase